MYDTLSEFRWHVDSLVANAPWGDTVTLATVFRCPEGVEVQIFNAEGDSIGCWWASSRRSGQRSAESFVRERGAQVPERFRDSVRRRMKRWGWTMSDLARVSGLDRSGLHRVLTGKAEPIAATIYRLEKALERGEPRRRRLGT